MYIYFKNNPDKFHPDPIWNNGALRRLFKKDAQVSRTVSHSFGRPILWRLRSIRRSLSSSVFQSLAALVMRRSPASYRFSFDDCSRLSMLLRDSCSLLVALTTSHLCCVVHTGFALLSALCTSWHCWLTGVYVDLLRPTWVMSYTSRHWSIRPTSPSLIIVIVRRRSFDTPPDNCWSCFSGSCITDMELSSTGSHVFFSVQWLQCSALFTLNFWLIDWLIDWRRQMINTAIENAENH